MAKVTKPKKVKHLVLLTITADKKLKVKDVKACLAGIARVDLEAWFDKWSAEESSTTIHSVVVNRVDFDQIP